MAKEKKGMTKEDIENKLKILKTDKGKFSYLKELSKKADILSPKTRKVFYETLGDYALKVDKMADAVEAYEKAGLKEGLIKAGEEAEKRREFYTAIKAYEAAGKKCPDLYIKEGDEVTEKGYDLLTTLDYYLKGGMKNIDEALNRISEKFEVYLNKISKLSGEQRLPRLDTYAYDAIKYLINGVNEMVDEKIIPKNERDKVLSKLGEMLLKEYEIFAKNPIYCCFRHDKSHIETGKKLLNESFVSDEILAEIITRCLNEGDADQAAKLYVKIKDKKSAEKIKDDFISRGMGVALYTNKKSCEKLSEKDLLEIAKQSPLNVAEEIYHKLNLKDKEAEVLAKRAELALEAGKEEEVKQIYKKLGKKFTKTELTKLGDAFLKKTKDILASEHDYRYKSWAVDNYLEMARRFFEKAGDKDNLIEVGDILVSQGKSTSYILECYKKGGLSKIDSMRRYIDKLLERDDLNEALLYAHEIKDKEKISEILEKAIKKRNEEVIDKIFKIKELLSKEDMEKLADAYERAGKGRKAMELRRKIEKLSK
ncbi:MAG: hypothetical protein QW484_02565 [Candidatus Pacearchaeota archaeon]